MAVLAVASVGALAGYGIAGATGLSIGWAVGSFIGQMLFAPKQHFEGPRLTDLQAVGSTDGSPIPIAFGTVRLQGRPIWQTDIKETVHEEELGKGGFGSSGTSTTYTYSYSAAIGFMDGEISGYRRIWMDGKLVYSVADGATPATFAANLSRGNIAFYLGTETQDADPTIEAHEGAGNVPGFRGHAYIVLTDWQLADFANHPPLVEAEIVVAAPFTFPYLRHVIPAVTVNSMALDERRLCAVYVEQLPAPGDKVYAWDLTANAPVAVATLSSDWPTVNAADATVIVDPVNDRYHVIAGQVSGGNQIYLESFDASTGAIVGGLRMIRTADYAPFVNANGNVEVGGVVNPTGWGWDPYRNVIWGLGQGYSSGDVFSIRIDPGSASATIAVLGPAGSAASVWFRRAHVDAQGGVWMVGSNQYQRFAPAPAWVASAYSLAASRSFLWKARQEIWTPPSIGSEWSVLDIATETEAAGSTLFASVTSYFTGAENAEGQAWFLKDSATTGYLDGVLINADLTVAKTLSAFVQATDGVLDAYAALPGVIIGAEVSANPQCFYEHSLAQDGAAVSDIVTTLCARCGLSAIDVTALTGESLAGYVVARPMSGRNAIEPLQMCVGFDGVESDEVIRFVKRGGASAAALTEDEMAARAASSGDIPAALKRTRAMETELPATLLLTYIDQANDYNIATVPARRINSPARNVIETQLPIVMNSQQAARIAENLLRQAWLEADRHEYALPPSFRHFDPTDIVTLPDGTRSRLVRITNGANGVLRCEAVGDDDGALTSYMTGTVGGPGAEIDIAGRGASLAEILDISLLRDLDDDVGRYFAACGESASWPGAVFYQSRDGGLSWAGVSALTTPAKLGSIVSGALIDPVEYGLLDQASAITVRLAQPGLTLAGPASDEAFFAGENAFAVSRDDNEWEIAQAYTVVDNGDGTYTLRDFLRGRKGSEWARGPFGAGARLVFLEAARLAHAAAGLAELDAESQWKAVTLRGNLIDEPARAHRFDAVSATPLAPASVGGAKQAASDDIQIFWTRRARIDGDWRSGGGGGLDEPLEQYELEIWDEGLGELKRTVAGLTAPAYVYTSAMQTSDFGAGVDAIGVKVFQISSRVGRGFAAAADVGAGAGVAITLDRTRTTAGLVLDALAKTATRAGASVEWAPASRAFATGRKYWECQVDGAAGNDIFLGITEKTSFATGDTTNTTLVRMWRGGQSFGGGGAAGDDLVNAFAGSSNMMRFAVDFTAGKIWATTNRDGWEPGADPENGIGETSSFTPSANWRPCLATSNSGASFSVTFRFGGGNIYPVPSGFGRIL